MSGSRVSVSAVLLLLCVLAQFQTFARQDVREVAVSNSLASTELNTEKNGSCRLGYDYANNTCQCRKGPNGIMKCSKDACGLYNFDVLECYCVTSNKSMNLVEIGACLLNCGSSSANTRDMFHHYVNESSDYNMCKPLNRIGPLCGRCLPDHYPLAYSYNFTCIKCRHTHWNWVRYIMAAYLPLTFFYLVILFFKINVVSSHLHPAVLYGQAMSIPPLARIMLLSISNNSVAVLTGFKLSLSLYGIWNLDFFRPFYSDLCLGIGILPTLALDYAIAMYPLLLMIISYLLIDLYDRNYRVVTTLWRPFRVLFKRNWNIRTSVIDAFSAFFLLSNIKFLSVSFDLLAPTRVYHLYGNTYNYSYRLFYAGDVEYFGSEHLPYAIIAIVVSLVCVILPIFLFTLYPFSFFQKFLNLFPVRWYILHTFVDSFQGCYKDGTEPGTRDYRWVSAVYLAFRCVSFILYGVTLNVDYFSLCSLLLLLVILLLVAFQPYKNRVALHFRSNTGFLILYSMYYTVLVAIQRANLVDDQGYFNLLCVVAAVLAFVPSFCILGYMMYWFFSRCKLKICFGVHMLHWWRRGYVAVDPADGDEAAADAYCDRMVNPQAYPCTVPVGQLVNYSSMDLN